ncbi:MAG: PEPxxWA-CTERM sorting domain-containing protein [Phenylobacterium sp.]|uniref:PEPxxWA-CTERM sorting domain-containing protein n=1 Tax=Phenylobacterium sp. TaxID=1871053 RepID=UPI001A3FA6E9|nr:PEPxxWA-CTERM sorting domain-containing protein [Phenylobacterium sp.]MBL8555288.1 PEPxxWA-CTERM sorting domain-containing protein [Phenylobacterium sp.]
MRRFLIGSLAALAMCGTAQAADYSVVNVLGTDMPWLWDHDALNVGYQFGTQDGTGPSVFNFADLGIGEGDSYGVLFVGGQVGVFGGPPDVTNKGYDYLSFKNDGLGSSGTVFPSYYMPGDYGMNDTAGVYLASLVGAFADAGGNVISPFSLGRVNDDGSWLIGFSSSLGAGITHVQFGINDDIFADNSGSFSVCIDRGDNACFDAFYGNGGGVPEPATWGLMIAGFGLAGTALRRRRAFAA